MNPLISCIALVCSVSGSPSPARPEDAARVLAASQSISNRTHVYIPRADEGPQVSSTRSRAGDGPYGAFPPLEYRPLGVHVIHGITFRLPREEHEKHRR